MASKKQVPAQTSAGTVSELSRSKKARSKAGERRNAGSSPAPASFTVPGMEIGKGEQVAAILQDRLNALIDLGLTLKHVHWNVVGPTFIGVHTMLDPQVDGVALMVDAVAERIATLGQSPNGLPGQIVANRSWDDYSLGRALVPEHLGALDLVYSGVIADHREAIEKVGELDSITEDLLIGQSGELEQYHWFVRAHLESASGVLTTRGATTETEAAQRALGSDWR